MTTLKIAAAIFASYSEKNSFELDPLPYKLTSCSVEYDRG